MNNELKTIDDYLNQIPEERKEPMRKLRKTINDNIPNGFKEALSYRMIGWIVPKTIYPDGYHCDPKLPLPFASIASQKNHIALYHMGLYADPDLLNWFKTEYAKQVSTKLDMGKSCIRFKNPKNIPYKLIGQLMSKMLVENWVTLYEKNIQKK